MTTIAGSMPFNYSIIAQHTKACLDNKSTVITQNRLALKPRKVRLHIWVLTNQDGSLFSPAGVKNYENTIVLLQTQINLDITIYNM